MSQLDMFHPQPEPEPEPVALSKSDSGRFASLEELIRALQNMTDDPLANAGTNVVISRGNPDA